MNFCLNIPVKIFGGENCVLSHSEQFKLGKRAFIVTGRRSAKVSGALDDVLSVLSDSSIEHEIYAEVTENPNVTACFEAGLRCKAAGCDLIIGIGGGSALDAAKSIAAFAKDEYQEPCDIFDPAKKLHSSLPIILIPTTAGTGSEANNYSVLTLPDGLKKKTFTHKDSWARAAFLDPKYTLTLSKEYTFSTALDAFHHALESFLSPRSDIISEMCALYAAKNIWDVLSQLPNEFSYQMREELLYASCAAGLAISITGTGFPHPLGYSLTLIDGIPHGKACAVFAKDYIEYNSKAEIGAERIERFCAELGIKKKVLGELLSGLADVDIKMTNEQIKEHVDLIKDAKNYSNSPYVLGYDEMISIYRSHFGRK